MSAWVLGRRGEAPGSPSPVATLCPGQRAGSPAQAAPADDGLAAFGTLLYKGGRPASRAVGSITCTRGVKCFCEMHSLGCRANSGQAWVLLRSLVSLCQQSEPTLQSSRGYRVGGARSSRRVPLGAPAARQTGRWGGFLLTLPQPGQRRQKRGSGQGRWAWKSQATFPERLPCDWRFVGIAGDSEVTCHLLRHLEAPYTSHPGQTP